MVPNVETLMYNSTQTSGKQAGVLIPEYTKVPVLFFHTSVGTMPVLKWCE